MFSHNKLWAIGLASMLSATASAEWSVNLLQNSNGDEGRVAAWTVDVGEKGSLPDDGGFAGAIRGIGAVKSSSNSTILPRTGNYMVEFGTKGATVKVHQGIDVGMYSRDIDAGIARIRTGGWFRSVTELRLNTAYTLYIGSAQYVLQFLDKEGNTIAPQQEIFMENYLNLSEWTGNEVTVSVPPGTRTINNVVQLNGQADSYLGLLADDLYFNIDATPNADPPVLPETGLRGAIYELNGATVTCKNLKTRKTVKGNLENFPVWNCSKLKLSGKSGQKVQIIIRGTLP